MQPSETQITFLFLTIIVLALLYWIGLRLGKKFSTIDPKLSFNVFSTVASVLFGSIIAALIVNIWDINSLFPSFYPHAQTYVKIAFGVIIVVCLGYLADYILYYYYLRNWAKRTPPDYGLIDQDAYYQKQNKRYYTLTIGILMVLNFLIVKTNFDFVIFQSSIKGEEVTIQFSHVISAIIIVAISRLLAWFVTNITLQSLYQKNSLEEGSQFAINQLIKYVIFVVGIFMALEQVVPDMKVIYGAGAALLVGIGLGLQQTFNDFFSGIVILFERSVMVGDILEMQGQVGRVLKIGLRASRIETRNSVSMLVPNSKLVNESVINWTHFDNVVRFQIDVGVAYGSDTQLVKEILLASVRSQDQILSYPTPFVRMNDFGDSALNFSLYYFSNYVMRAEDVKSNLRFEIDRLFREHNITIPFPQRDVWIRKNSAIVSETSFPVDQ
ncbi:MAG: mechanosensitive ion channel [Saprospiraceae bacterium]